MKDSTRVITNAIDTAYCNFHKICISYEHKEIPLQLCVERLQELREGVASLLCKNPTKTSVDKIKRFLKVCDNHINVIIKEDAQ